LKIQGADRLTFDQVQREVERGGKFVIYQYCFSVLVMTFRRSTDIYFIRPGESAVVQGMQWTLISLVAGWWGFPWGLIYTPMALFQNLKGGKDVTPQVLGQYAQSAAPPTASSGVWPPPPTAFPST
jgi:hypothetical protein